MSKNLQWAPICRFAALFVAVATVSASAENTKPLKVFILCGQSNMQGHANISTFAPMRLDPKTAPILKEMVNDDGTPRVCDDVWISSIGCAEEEQVGKLTAGFGASKNGPKIGPEFTFGIYMRKLVDEPILIIKTSWGGKSINTDFRPPSAGSYQFRDEQLRQFEDQGKDVEKIKADRAAASGHYYRLMLDHVRKVLGDINRVYPDYDASQGYELAGFVWFQGWNDMVDGGSYPSRGQPGSYDTYSDLLAQFIRDVRKDLSAPKLPFVIGVMGAGGPIAEYGPEKQRYAGIHGEFRKAMAAPAALPEFEGNVAAVWTEKYWDLELDDLRTKDREIKGAVKKLQEEGKLDRAQASAEIEKRRNDAFDARELEILTKSTSNFEFHYLGSAKVMAQIGKGFAEANFALLKK
jgi:hypothetical protein